MLNSIFTEHIRCGNSRNPTADNNNLTDILHILQPITIQSLISVRLAFISLMELLFVEERGLPGGRQQSLPILLLRSEAVFVSTEHLFDWHHGNSVLEMADCEVGVPTHQTLNAAEGNLAE